MGHRRLTIATILVLGGADASAGSIGSGVTTPTSTPFETETPATGAGALEYWTPERMRSATPREAYRIVTPEEAAEQAEFGGTGYVGHERQSGGGSVSAPSNWRELSTD